MVKQAPGIAIVRCLKWHGVGKVTREQYRKSERISGRGGSKEQPFVRKGGAQWRSIYADLMGSSCHTV